METGLIFEYGILRLANLENKMVGEFIITVFGDHRTQVKCSVVNSVLTNLCKPRLPPSMVSLSFQLSALEGRSLHATPLGLSCPLASG